MMKTSQISIVQNEILKCLYAGETNLNKIYTIVFNELETVPRPTIRRVKGLLLQQLEDQVKILKNESAY